MSIVGQRYAYRQRAHTRGEPVRPVEVVKEGPPRSQKVRIRWLDGEYEGLEEWVPMVRLVAAWDQADAFLEDERRVLRALAASGDAYGTLEWKAAQEVFFGLPEYVEVALGWNGGQQELLFIENLDTTAPLLGLRPDELLAEPEAFVDRAGWYKAPFPVALKVARLCCQ
jgi:hypothetical protein